MKIGFYAGSFDPFTNGHLHVVKKSSELFDKVIIGIGTNSQKNRRFDSEAMKTAIQQVIVREGLTNVSVITYSNLTVDMAHELNATFLIRGIRNGIDYNYEENVALINEELSGLDTIYVRSGKYGAVSSSMITEILSYGKDVSNLVPQEVYDIIKNN